MTDETVTKQNALQPVHCGCGGEAEIFHIAPDEGYEGSYCVRCTKCLTQTPFFNKDKEKAIMTWNKAMGAEPKTFVIPITASAYKIEFTANGKIVAEGWTCQNCGGYVQENDKYCKNCGCRLEWE